MKAIDITGERFGELLVIRPVSTDDGLKWLCLCDCGAKVIRSGGYLRYRQRLGSIQSCQTCAREARRGKFIDTHESYTAHLVDYYEEHGVLYSPNVETVMCTDVLDELEERFGRIEEVLEPRAYEPLYWENTSPASGQRAAYLVPSSHAQSAPDCVTCGGYVGAGFLCAGCRKHVCRSCVSWEIHYCKGSRKWNWEKAMAKANPSTDIVPLEPIVPLEELQRRIDERINRLSEEEAIKIARAAQQAIEERMERLIRRGQRERAEQKRREQRERTAQMPPSVRRIVLNEPKWPEEEQWVDS